MANIIFSSQSVWTLLADDADKSLTAFSPNVGFDSGMIAGNTVNKSPYYWKEIKDGLIRLFPEDSECQVPGADRV